MHTCWEWWLALKPGDVVVFTGMSEARKRELSVLAEALGLVAWPNVQKGVAAVIAQDPGSNSGKARKAPEYGIPVEWASSREVREGPSAS